LHTLTKVFIVIWALLSILVLALTIPLAFNQDTWKQKTETAKAEKVAMEREAALSVSSANDAVAKQQQIQADLNAQITQLKSDLNNRLLELSDLRNRLASATQGTDRVQTELSTLTASVQTQAQIIETQGEEITQRRDESLRLQKRNIDLEDQLRDVMTTLDVSLEAQRILQERIVGLNNQIENLKSGGSQLAGNEEGPQYLPAPKVEGRVLRIDDDASGTRLVTVDLGTRDGLSENMRFLVARDGQFIANLIITAVDLNRAVGRVALEKDDGIKLNDRVIGGIGPGLSG